MSNNQSDRAISMAEFMHGLSTEATEDLRAQGIEIDTLAEAAKTFNDLQIPEPRYDEKVIGNLTEEELKLFVLVATISDKFEDLQHELSGNAMIAAGHAVINKDKSPENIKKELEHKAKEFEELFKCERKLETYKSAMYHSICVRLGHWDWVMGIRAKQRIVVTERKW